MAKKAGLQLIISLVDETTSGMQKITGSMKGLAMVGGAAVVAGMAAVGKAAWDAGILYDDAMDTIITKTGASGDVLTTLESDFKTVFSSVPTDAQTAADVIANLNQKVGLTGPVLQDASKSLLEMSRLMGGDAAKNASDFGRVMGDWSIPADDASGALDKLFVASQESGIGVDTLMQRVVQFGAPLRNMGFTLDESVALLASFEKEGVNSELVLGSMRIAAGKFAKEGVPLRESLLATFDAIQNNTNASDALAMGMEVFGARAGPDMVAAIREGRFSVEDMTAAMADAEGAIMKTADATADFPEKFQVLRNKVTTLLMPLGSIMVTGLSGALDAIGPAVDTAIGWLKNVTAEGTPLSGMWLSLQNLAATVWPGLRDAIVSSMQGVWDIIVNYVVPALSEIFTWLATNLPPAIQAASDFFNNTLLPALTVIANFIRQNVVPVVVEIITWLATNLPPAIQAASDFFNNTLLPALTAVYNFITTQVVPAIVAINDWLGAKIGPVIEIAAAAFNQVLLPVLTLVWDIIVQKLVPIIKELYNWLGTTILTAIGRAKQAFGELKTKLDPVLQVIKDVVDWIKNKLQPTFNNFKDFIGSIHFSNPFSGLLDTIKDVIGKIEDAIRKLRDLLGLTGGAGSGGSSSGFSLNAPTTTQLQLMPELVMLPRASRVFSAGETQRLAGGNTFYFQFAAPATAYDERRVEAAVERAMASAGVRADNRQRTR